VGLSVKGEPLFLGVGGSLFVSKVPLDEGAGHDHDHDGYEEVIEHLREPEPAHEEQGGEHGDGEEIFL